MGLMALRARASTSSGDVMKRRSASLGRAGDGEKAILTSSTWLHRISRVLDVNKVSNSKLCDIYIYIYIYTYIYSHTFF